MANVTGEGCMQCIFNAVTGNHQKRSRKRKLAWPVTTTVKAKMAAVAILMKASGQSRKRKLAMASSNQAAMWLYVAGNQLSGLAS